MKKKTQINNLIAPLFFGICFGVAYWLIFDNIIVGISIGVILDCTIYSINN